MSSSSTKAQISIEFYAAFSAVLLLFLSSLLLTMQLRRAEESRQIRTASLMLAQKIANSADLMHRNLCNGENCSISIFLPAKIRALSFPKEVGYNVSFSSNWVEVEPDGYPNVSIAASMSFDGSQISLQQNETGKLLTLEVNG